MLQAFWESFSPVLLTVLGVILVADGLLSFFLARRLQPLIVKLLQQGPSAMRAFAFFELAVGGLLLWWIFGYSAMP